VGNYLSQHWFRTDEYSILSCNRLVVYHKWREHSSLHVPVPSKFFFCAEHCYLSSRLAPTCSSWQLCFLEKSHMELGFSSQISELKYILICPYSRFPELKIGRHSLVILWYFMLECQTYPMSCLDLDIPWLCLDSLTAQKAVIRPVAPISSDPPTEGGTVLMCSSVRKAARENQSISHDGSMVLVY
jgi:hypothetical protein